MPRKQPAPSDKPPVRSNLRTSNPSWLAEVTPDDEVMAAFYRGGNSKKESILEESLDTSSVTSSITKPGVSLTPPSPKSPEDTEHGTVLNNPLPLILQPSSPLTPLPDSLPPLDTSSQTIYSKVVENTSLFTSQFPENLSTDTVRKGTEGYGTQLHILPKEETLKPFRSNGISINARIH